MENMSSRLTFRHGIHPEAYKDQTADLAIERMPFVEEYAVPVAQHAGAPSVPLVQKGQHVTRGDVIARPDAFVSVAQHAPVT
ncbi:MAG TPA: electron transport complex subunit RsxC, partial [bacterium]|nr:electron transport complex subunit RsxC [bacterium]